MSLPLKTLAFLLLGLFFICCFNSVESLKCGSVYDGFGAHDSNVQAELDQIKGQWKGFEEEGDEGVTYSFAIISEGIAPPEMLKKDAATLKTRLTEEGPEVHCSKGPLEIDGEPDVVGWTNVKDGNAVLSQGLQLHTGYEYFFLLKATQGKQVLYAHSNGIIVGIPEYIYIDHDDDDDDFPAWEAGLIFMGCALCCLLLLLLLLLVVAKGKGEDKYTTTVHRNENVDKI